MNKVYKTLAVGGLSASLFFTPVKAKAFYVSQKEAQKAGISIKDITKDKQPMGDKVSYTGTLEDNETFNDIADRTRRGLEDFCGTELSEKTFRKAMANFNSYRKVEMPSVSVPCKYQGFLNYVRVLEKESKPGYEKEMESLKSKLQELEELYEQDISELRGKYEEHDKRIEDLEKMPAVKDYDRKSRLEMEDMEPEERLGSMEMGYAQPPVAGYGYGEVIFGQPGWFPFVPYPYVIWNGSIYCREYFENTFRWRYWGMFDDYGYGFRARRLDGRIFDYHGPRSLFRDYYSDHRRLPDGKQWKGMEKDLNPRGRAHELRNCPDPRDRRFEGKTWNDGRFDRRGFQREAPKMYEDRRNKTMERGQILRQEYKGGLPQGGKSQQNFQGLGLNVQPRNLGQGSRNFTPNSPQNLNPGPRHR